jgi:hypothetical protein
LAGRHIKNIGGANAAGIRTKFPHGGNHRQVPFNGNRKAEMVLCRCIGRRELVQLLSRGHVKQIGGARVLACSVFYVRTDNRHVSAECDGVSERIKSRRIFWSKFEEFISACDIEHVGRARVDAGAVVRWCTDKGNRAAHCHCPPKQTTFNRV